MQNLKNCSYFVFGIIKSIDNAAVGRARQPGIRTLIGQQKYDAEIDMEEFMIKWFWKKYLVILAGILEFFFTLGVKNIFKIKKLLQFIRNF